MELLKPVFTTYLFDVEVITPVHIGMAQEKNYVRGLDYVLVDDEAWIINSDKLLLELNQAELQNLSTQLTEGSVSKLEPTLIPLLKNNPEKLLLDKLKTGGSPNEIRRFYRTGTGNYALPGTSLKGAIRSVFLAELKNEAEFVNSPGRSRQKDELDELMGNITNNLMRFIQVGDVDFSRKPPVEVRRTKVFSADSASKGIEEEGMWKHGNTTSNGDCKHSPVFADSRYGQDGFVTFYETLIPRTHYPAPTLTIRLGNDLPFELGHYATGTYLDNGVKKQNVPNYKAFLAKRSGEWLLKIIQAHTNQYLTREKAYFAKFENKDLDKLKPIQERLDDLIRLNKSPDSCLLRVGSGVGFHSITGDWQDRSQKDHTQSWIEPSGQEVINGSNRERHKKLKNQIFAKTRKFAFEQVAGGIDFALMGFVKLSLQTLASLANREQQQHQAKEFARLAIEAEANRLEEERLQAEEARKPKMFIGKVKKGSIVDAEVLAVNGIRVTLKLYVPDHNTDQFVINYNGLSTGRILQVDVKDVSGKGKIQAVGFKAFK